MITFISLSFIFLTPQTDNSHIALLAAAYISYPCYFPSVLLSFHLPGVWTEIGNFSTEPSWQLLEFLPTSSPDLSGSSAEVHYRRGGNSPIWRSVSISPWPSHFRGCYWPLVDSSPKHRFYARISIDSSCVMLSQTVES